MTEGQRVLLVEDLTTDGGSKLSFVDAIRETGATCGHTAVIFYYGIFPDTEANAGRPRRGAASPLHLVGRAGRGPRARAPSMRRRWPRWRASCSAPRAWQDAAQGLIARSRRSASGGSPPHSPGGTPQVASSPLSIAASRCGRVKSCAISGLCTAVTPRLFHRQTYQVARIRPRARSDERARGSSMTEITALRPMIPAAAPAASDGRGPAPQHRGRAAASGRDPDQQRHLRPHRRRGEGRAFLRPRPRSASSRSRPRASRRTRSPRR